MAPDEPDQTTPRVEPTPEPTPSPAVEVAGRKHERVDTAPEDAVGSPPEPLHPCGSRELR